MINIIGLQVLKHYVVTYPKYKTFVDFSFPKYAKVSFAVEVKMYIIQY